MPVAETFAFEDEEGRCLGDLAQLDTMVIVIDAANFLTEYGSTDALKDRGMELNEQDDRNLVDLLTEHWPEDEDECTAIRSDFDGEYGDRRQELVFIGIEMQRSALEFELNNCLVTDEEFECGPSVWSAFRDPFPEQLSETES